MIHHPNSTPAENKIEFKINNDRNKQAYMYIRKRQHTHKERPLSAHRSAGFP